MKITWILLAAIALTSAAVIPEQEYLPPTEEVGDVAEAPVEESAALANDGYQYKTIRKLKYRNRRDVSELSSQYLPPSEASVGEYLPPTEEVAAVTTEAPEESAILADDGYRYKTVRKLKYRKRRDVSELVAPEYLPPSEEVVEDAEPTEAPEESAVLVDDGYRYKTVRRLKYRKRRDVSELIAPEYLPPTEEVVEEVEPTEAPEESAALADDGYRYKTVRRLKYRKRRDVSELVAPVYLPPSEEVVEDAEPTEAPEESAVLVDDGYRYKTVRRLKYRKRRDVSELIAPEYLPPTEEVVEEVEPTEAPEESAALADDGYRYKTVRRLKYRKRRDVSELVAPEYLPPTEEVVEEVEPTEAPEESAVLADDGYRYKTVRRLKYRKRRDVSELVAPEYLPPTEEVVDDAEPTEAPEESAALADDGYRYKTVRRLKYRKRRDVSELVAPEYLPPTEEVVEDAEPTEAPEESAALADDGYRYKTVRRLKYRKRRDVSELVAPEYLPPTAEVIEDAEPTEAPEESAALSDDGYRYKTVRRLKYRKRRDVSELVAPEYLPPSEEVVEDAEPTEAPEESAALADDGYRYKTVRRLKYRKRRDVSELVAPEYLPPTAEVIEDAEPTEAPEESAALSDDGYRYKTVRRLKYRKRRDVSELVAPEYLPPTAEVIEDAEPTEAPEKSAVLADDGYRYKTVLRLKYRKRRDVSELVAPEYLPPTEEVVEDAEPTEAPEESAALADDGYRYKTVRRLKYRKRRDVSELVAPEYLPPTEEVVEDAEPTEAPEESAALADDGYRYKTVRRLKYRKRRDVSELVAPEYLPPSEEVVEDAEPTEAPEESAALADDGYRYKTVRRLKYRKRRDVSELVAPEYLPPTEEVVEDAEPTEAPEESAALADDGYRYKTVRRLKYRKRRDVSELVAPEYLPPTEEVVEDAEPTEAPEESAALADDGYRYKTVRRLKYRKRRDVSELVAPEYLPPSEEVVEDAEPTEAPEESAVLADDGYRYKTVRRLKYRKRRDVSELIAHEYLPPTEDTVEVNEAPEVPEESAVLADDGYRYKTVKRFKYRN